MQLNIAALLTGILLTVTTYTASAQIYPVTTDLFRMGLKGPVETVVQVSRSYSSQVQRWEPLMVTTILHFNREGFLLKKGTYISRQKPDKDLYTYDAESDKALPVFDVTSTVITSAKNEPLEELLYAYDKGKLVGIIERDYKSGKTLKREYVYEGKQATAIISRDSATGLIAEIEQFYYQKDGKPTGSYIRYFDTKSTPVREPADTAAVPANRILRDYTSYVYTDTTTPVIFWHWHFGNDTTIDEQEIKRFLPDGTMSASTSQTFVKGKITGSQSYLYNNYGDILSSAASFGSDTTFERGFYYVYEALDDRENWTVRRQVSGDAGSIAAENKRMLISRSDRNITYYK